METTNQSNLARLDSQPLPSIYPVAFAGPCGCQRQKRESHCARMRAVCGDSGIKATPSEMP